MGKKFIPHCSRSQILWYNDYILQKKSNWLDWTAWKKLFILVYIFLYITGNWQTSSLLGWHQKNSLNKSSGKNIDYYLHFSIRYNLSFLQGPRFWWQWIYWLYGIHYGEHTNMAIHLFSPFLYIFFILMFNRPGVAGAVLQSPRLLIH